MNTMRMLAAIVAAVWIAAIAHAEEKAEGLKRIDWMIGEWRGTSRGQPGEGTMQRVCERVLADKFIECRTTVTYPREVHVDRAFFSYDKSAKKLRLRQFHGEGFVNTYTETDPLTFTTSDIENIPAGWRARETYEQPSRDQWSERFELAQPGKDFTLYSSTMLERVK